jgi:hypothetical protein
MGQRQCTKVEIEIFKAWNWPNFGIRRAFMVKLGFFMKNRGKLFWGEILNFHLPYNDVRMTRSPHGDDVEFTWLVM